MINKSSDNTASGGQIDRYLGALGLKPGASLDEVNTTYFTIVKRFPQNPTEEDEARMQELKHAYNILQRAYVPKPRKSIEVLLDRRYLAPVAGTLAAVMIAALVFMNFSTIKMKLVRFESGTVLRMKSQNEPYGQVVGFEAQHRFPSGNPSSAYAIRLSGRDETVWVGERLVVNGMIKAEAK